MKLFLLDGEKVSPIPDHALKAGLASLVRTSEAGEPASTVEGATQTVPWFAACIDKRAQALAGIPVTVRFRKSGKPVPTKEAPWQASLPELLLKTERSLCKHGVAYWQPVWSEGGTLLDLRWIAARTITERYSTSKGIAYFERRPATRKKQTDPDETARGYFPATWPGPEHDPLSGDRMIGETGDEVVRMYPVDFEVRRKAKNDRNELIYFHLPDDEEEMAPGLAPAVVALEVARLAHYVNVFSINFFRRGAVPLCILQVEGNPPDTELRRLESTWKRMLMGVTRAWQTIAVRASVHPQIIGPPIRDLSMPALLHQVRQQICVAFGVSHVLLEDATFASTRNFRESLYTETVIPQSRVIGGAVNRQLLWQLGMELTFDYANVKALQEDEVQRAGAFMAYRNGGFPVLMTTRLLGIDLSEDDRKELEAMSKRREMLIERSQEQAVVQGEIRTQMAAQAAAQQARAAQMAAAQASAPQRPVALPPGAVPPPGAPPPGAPPPGGSGGRPAPPPAPRQPVPSLPRPGETMSPVGGGVEVAPALARRRLTARAPYDPQLSQAADLDRPPTPGTVVGNNRGRGLGA